MWTRLGKKKYDISLAGGPSLAYKVKFIFVRIVKTSDVVPVIISYAPCRAYGCCGDLRTDGDAILNGVVLTVVGLVETCRGTHWYSPPVCVIRDCPIVPTIDTLPQVLKLCVLLRSYLVDPVIQANVCIS